MNFKWEWWMHSGISNHFTEEALILLCDKITGFALKFWFTPGWTLELGREQDWREKGQIKLRAELKIIMRLVRVGPLCWRGLISIQCVTVSNLLFFLVNKKQRWQQSNSKKTCGASIETQEPQNKTHIVHNSTVVNQLIFTIFGAFYYKIMI